MTKHTHEGRTLHVWRVLALSSVLALAPMVTGFPQLSSPAEPHPVESRCHQVGFVKSSVVAMRAARQATHSVASTPGAPDPITTARAGAVTAVQDVPGGVAVVGVTWPKDAVTAKDQFQIRTLTGATWSQWQTFENEEADGPGHGVAVTWARMPVAAHWSFTVVEVCELGRRLARGAAVARGLRVVLVIGALCAH